MAKLLITANTDRELTSEIARACGVQIVACERDGLSVYLAASLHGVTSALIACLTPLRTPMPDGENWAVKLMSERDDPSPARASASFLAQLCAPASGLGFSRPEIRWRQRCEEWGVRVRAAHQGQCLLAEYPDAEGRVAYNEVAKTAFERDGRRFRQAVLRHLDRPGQVEFNSGGVAGSGTATLRSCAQGWTLSVFIDASGTGPPDQSSPSGVCLRWHLESGTERFTHRARNRWAAWDSTAAALAREIRRTLDAEFGELQQRGA